MTLKICLRKYLLGKDIALVSDKTPVEYKDEGFNIVQDKMSSNVAEQNE